MNAPDYRPQYDDTVYEYQPDGEGGISQGPWDINPAYCLMPASARILASLWTPAPAILSQPPIPQGQNSPFAFNHNVPWLKFPNGALRNAALLAGYWGMPGVPYESAMQYAQLDVDTPVPDQG